jgi:cyclophilin family peptidyl-prolyl cis-trans isomerase/HEAT repeat protein
LESGIWNLEPYNPALLGLRKELNMRLMRWSLVAVLLPLVRCAAPAPPAPGGPAAAAAPPAASTRFASLAQAEAALVEIEDRRAFDRGLLASAATATDPAIRARAALAIGRIGDDRGASLLRPLVSDKSGPVRAAAAFGIQLLGDPGATPDLLPLLSDADVLAASSAAAAIGSLGRGDGEDALIAAIPVAPAPEPRASMLQSLWRFASPASTSAALKHAGDADARVRSAALYALSRKPIVSSASALTAALSDSDPYAAAMAARGLGVLALKDSIPPLAAALDSGKTPLVTNSLIALEAILEKNPGAVVAEDRKARILALAGDANPNLAVSALVLLRQFEATDRQIRQRLWSIALTGEGRRRQVAVVSVVAALRERAKDVLEAAASSPDRALRATAAETLAFLPVAPAKPYRERLASDREAAVRLAVLGSLKTPDAVRESRALVNSALTDADPGVRAAAVDALGLLAEASVLPLVSDALARSQADASPDVAIAVIAVCERLRTDPAARSIVESAFHQGKTLVARLARRSLIQSFRADRAALAAPEYKTGRTAADYAALLSEAHRPLQARVETARGEFVIRLAGRDAPLTVANFVKLARASYFDGVGIHRVVPNFVLQDGDPTGTGNGGPGYEIRDELNPLPYERGAVGMALSGPDTGGSQWFVTHSPQPHLNGLYTVFGHVVAGQEIVEGIDQGDLVRKVTISEAP